MKKLICSILAVVFAFCAVCPAVLADGTPYGDVDFSGNVNSGDALLVLQYATSLKDLTDDAKAVADVNADGSINSGDALSILQFATNLIEKFPAEEKKAPSTMEDILDLYKDVAAANGEISTAQTFDLVDLDLGSFLLTTAFKPLATLVIDANTVDVEGFPGDAANLTVDDLESASYVENDDGTMTVTLNIKSQTDGLVGSKYEGPVGRAIGVVGDIPQVLKDTGTEDFVNVDDTTAELVYDDAVIKVTVDENLKLVKDKCSWTYTVYGDVKNVDISYSALAINIKDGSGTAEIDYKLAY